MEKLCHRMLVFWSAGFLLGLLCLAQPARGQVFLPDDPLWEDPDRLDMPHPHPREVEESTDLLRNTFLAPGNHGGPAANANTLAEVPNSSWYTNRHYWRRMSIEALRRGPNTMEGPSEEEPWSVMSGEEEGGVVRIEIEDVRGDRYLLKFDPEGYPELSTGAEAVAAKIFYALGYHVPEKYVVRFAPDQLVPGEGSGLTQRRIQRLLSHASMSPDGAYRALASKRLEGVESLGPFRFYGTRLDDANDVFPHEGRRELRGLRVFAAWLQYEDAHAVNTLDMLVEEEGRQFVRHYLVDFSSAFGGTPEGPKHRWMGYEYLVDVGPMLARAFTLGFAGSEWLDYEYSGHPSVGRFAAEPFDPHAWKPRYPNPAFRRCDAQDAFWAAKQVMHFTDEEIEALVSTGQYTSEGAGQYIIDALIERRDKIGAAYLSLGGGLDRFEVEGDSLVFTDLLAEYDLAEANRQRTVSWHVFDNESGEVGERLRWEVSSGAALALPISGASFLLAEIATPGQGRTRVFLRRSPDAGYEVVGLDRHEGGDE